MIQPEMGLAGRLGKKPAPKTTPLFQNYAGNGPAMGGMMGQLPPWLMQILQSGMGTNPGGQNLFNGPGDNMNIGMPRPQMPMMGPSGPPNKFDGNTFNIGAPNAGMQPYPSKIGQSMPGATTDMRMPASTNFKNRL